MMVIGVIGGPSVSHHLQIHACCSSRAVRCSSRRVMNGELSLGLDQVTMQMTNGAPLISCERSRVGKKIGSGTSQFA